MNKKFLIPLSLSFFGLSPILYAQNSLLPFEKYMQAETELYGFNGNVLVTHHGEVIFKKSFGYADYNTKTKLDSNSIFDCSAESKTKFYFADGTDQQIEFETDKKGNPIKIRYFGWGLKKEIKLT